APTATDNCPGVRLTSDHNSGENFPSGVTTVTNTATDAAGNATSRSFTVTVVDDTKPVIALGANLSLPTDPGQCAAGVASLGTTATDNAPGVTLAGVRRDGAALSASFSGGTTTITWTATDASGNTATATQTVTVNDAESPVISGMPANMTVTSQIVTWTQPVATGNCPGVTLSSDFHSGECFPVGTTTVTYTATDAVRHITRRGFTVTVVDNTKPVIATSNLTVPTDPGQCAALVGSLGTTATDNMTGVTLTGVRSDGAALSAPFPGGVTTITWTAIDGAGNTASRSFTVTVVDDTKPVIALGANVSLPTDPGQCAAGVASLGTTATDNAPGVTLAGVRSDGAALSASFPGGTTTITWTAT